MRDHQPQLRRDDPDSLAPLQIERLSVDEEAALMNRGKGGQLLALGAVVSLCAAIAAFWVDGMNTRRAYADALGSARTLRERHMNAFLHCALPGVQLAQIASSEQLHTAIERISERRGRSYGRGLERCMPRLAGMASGLRALRAPGEQAKLAAVHKAAIEHERAWDDYRSYLRADDSAYDYLKALPRIDKIASAFAAYERTSAEFDVALRARL